MRTGMGFAFAAALGLVAGCATAPKSSSERRSLEARADATLDTMIARDPGLRDVVDRAYGYAVFPEVGKGGLLVGGAYGRGIVYEKGRKVGFVELNQASIGAQLGGQTFSELLVFRDRAALEELKGGDFEIGAGASAVVLTKGAATGARFERGVALFVLPRGGLMVDVSVTGQQLNFQPRG
jgi:lipid-binding SYLF domain-containing protein